MALDVNILTVDPSDNSLDITVSVSTSSRSLITDYQLNINDTGTGGTSTKNGSLDGTAGFGPGDEVIHEVSFGLNPPEEGTVTAQITSPEEYVGVQDQQSWEAASGSLAINECNTEPTSGGDLEVSYTLTPSIGAEGTSREVGIIVDGQRVGSTTHTIPGRTITRTQTIPASNLPTGTDMPVEIEVGGDFSECGTVTVESDDPADDPNDGGDGGTTDPAQPFITDCSITNDDPLRMTVRADGDGSSGSTDAVVVVDGQQVALVTLDYALNPIDNQIEVPSDQLPVGTSMPVEIRL